MNEGLAEYREAFWAMMEEEQPIEIPCRPYVPLTKPKEQQQQSYARTED